MTVSQDPKAIPYSTIGNRIPTPKSNPIILLATKSIGATGDQIPEPKINPMILLATKSQYPKATPVNTVKLLLASWEHQSILVKMQQTMHCRRDKLLEGWTSQGKIRKWLEITCTVFAVLCASSSLPRIKRVCSIVRKNWSKDCRNFNPLFVDNHESNNQFQPSTASWYYWKQVHSLSLSTVINNPFNSTTHDFMVLRVTERGGG